jgi:hypothetical protein
MCLVKHAAAVVQKTKLHFIPALRAKVVGLLDGYKIPFSDKCQPPLLARLATAKDRLLPLNAILAMEREEYMEKIPYRLIFPLAWLKACSFR